MGENFVKACLVTTPHGPHEWLQVGKGNWDCLGVRSFGRIERPESDPVKHPQHYMKHPSGVEIIDITRHHSFTIGNALKYLFRHEHKGRPVEDLRKAIAYIEFAIEDLEKEGK